MFSDEEKRVFEYASPHGPVRADPVALQRRLNQLLGGNVNEVVERSNGGAGVVAMNATDQLAEAARIAFSLPWDNGAGPNEDAVLAVVDDFHKWLKKNSPSGESSPTCPQPSVSSSTD